MRRSNGYGAAWLAAVLLLFTHFCLAADGNVETGEMFYRQGKLDQALAVLLEADRRSPGDARTLSTLGRTWFHLGAFEKARTKLAESLASDARPPWVTCWSNVYLGKIAALQGDLDGAGNRLKGVLSRQYSPACTDEARRYQDFIRVLSYARDAAARRVESPCCAIHYNEADADGAGQSIDVIQGKIQTYADEIIKKLALESTTLPRVDIYLYPDEKQGQVRAAREIFARHRKNEFHVNYGDVDFCEHELVHFYTADRLSTNRVSPVFVEGLAEYVVGAPWGIPLDAWVVYFLENDLYVPLHELMNGRRFRQIHPIIAYEQAGSFVSFLITTYGLGRFYNLYSGDRTMGDVTGKSLTEVEHDWLKGVRKTEMAGIDRGLIAYRLEAETSRRADESLPNGR